MKKNVVLLVSHFTNDKLFEKYYKIRDCFDGDCVLLVHDVNKKEIPIDINSEVFTTRMLNELQYKPIRQTIIPGSNHFSVLWFYLKHIGYKHYWNIEYDVDFSGDWDLLFSDFSNNYVDFISSHILDYTDCPDWDWWDSFVCCDNNIPKKKRLRSFNPIYRISNDALNFLDIYLKEGNKGHHEVLIPTVLNYYQYKIIDFGGLGKFVPDGYKNKYYSNELIYGSYMSTMNYRPIFDQSIINQIRDKLIHPIKIKD